MAEKNKPTAKRVAKVIAKPAISDDAVKAATGKSWKEWFALLDKHGAKLLTHKQIAELLDRKYLDSGWWAQSVTVMYEHSRGLRELHEKVDGFAANVSKTFNVSLDRLYAAWQDGSARANWLAEQGIEITRETVNKSIRMLWSDGRTRVEANFYPKGKDKAVVQVEHSKFDSAADVAEARSNWKAALDRLQKKLAQYG
jgi:hypothetical protein